MQFYNDKINKELDKLEQEFTNLEIYLTKVIYNDFNEYLKTGNLKSYEEFSNSIKIDLSKVVVKSNEIINKYVEKNDIELDEQMEKYDKKKVSSIQRKFLDMTNELEIYGSQIIYQNYLTYVKMCGDFNGI